MTKPVLPDGLVAIVKRECATCVMTEPVLAAIAATQTLTVFTQDDATFPASVPHSHDADLSVSWHHEIETVPTLIRVENGVEVDRTFGWSRDAWRTITGIADLGDDLPVMRPGCGSLSVDPDLVDKLRARFTYSVLTARHIEMASAEDEFESMFNRGWTDGLPVIPPTPERVLRMLSGTTRKPDDVVAIAPPDLVALTSKRSPSTRSWRAAYPSTCHGSLQHSKRCATTASTCTVFSPRRCRSDR
jgi:hypothetical protein